MQRKGTPQRFKATPPPKPRKGGSRGGTKPNQARSSPRPSRRRDGPSRRGDGPSRRGDGPSRRGDGPPREDGPPTALSVLTFGSKKGDTHALPKRPYISDKVQLVKMNAKISTLMRQLNKLANENLQLKTILARRQPENPQNFLENKRGSLEMSEALVSRDRRFAQVKASLVLKKFASLKRHKQFEDQIGLHDRGERPQNKFQLKSLIFAQKSEAASLRQLQTKIDKIDKKRENNFHELLTILGRVQDVAKRVANSSLYGSMQDLAKQEAFFAHGSNGLSVTKITTPGKEKKELPSLFGKNMPKESKSKPKRKSKWTNSKTTGISFNATAGQKNPSTIHPRGNVFKFDR